MRKRTVSTAAWGLAVLMLSARTTAAQEQPSREAVTWVRGAVPIVLTIRGPADARRFPRDAAFTVAARNISGKTIVAWGAQVFERDRKARLRPTEAYAVRPRAGLTDSLGLVDAFTVGGPRPAFDARATFAVFEDGSWAGNGAMARREIASMREEYAAARGMRALLAALPDTPDRHDLMEASLALVRAHASVRSNRTRVLRDSVLRTLATALDVELLGSRTLAQMVDIARGAVDRQLKDLERLTFVTAPGR